MMTHGLQGPAQRVTVFRTPCRGRPDEEGPAVQPHASPPATPAGGAPDTICNNLVRALGEFSGPRRVGFCTALAAQVAALTAEALVRFAPAVVAAHPIVAIVPEPRPSEESP